MTDSTTRLDVYRALQAIDPADGYPRCLVWLWKQADQAKAQLFPRRKEA